MFTRTFAFVLLVYVFSIVASQMEANVYPVYLTNIGYSVTQAGIFTSIQNWMLCISPLAIAPFLTRSKHPDRFLFYGTLIHLTGAVVYLILSAAGNGIPAGIRYGIILGIRIFQSFGYSMYIVAGLTMVTEFVSARVMMLRLAMYYNGGSIAAGIGPSLALWTAGRFGYSASFALVVVFFVLTLLCCAALMLYDNNQTIGQTETVPVQAGGVLNRFGQIFALRALRASAMFFIYEIAIGIVFGFIVLFSAELGLAGTGIFLIVYHLCAILIRTLMDRILLQLGRGRAMIGSLSAMAVGTLSVFLARGSAGIILAGIFIGLGDGINYTLMNMQVIESVPEEQRSSASGTFLSVKGMGIALGNVAGGRLAGMMGLRNIYGIAAVMFALLAAGFTAYYLSGWMKVHAAVRRRRPQKAAQ